MPGPSTRPWAPAFAASSCISNPSRARPSTQPRSAGLLSERELEVLRMVADGQTNRAVGEHLGLSSLTVKSHLARIARKMGCGDRAEMVATSIRNGYIA
ncbi:MAG: LuxR C-terminal-related transcriptional regulator [Candidatus Nanopelagicales bacterium]